VTFSNVHVFQHTYEAAVRYGVESIGVCCDMWERDHTQLTLRRKPKDDDFDLHVNIFSSEGCPEVRDLP
jgi:hypothetical protein